MSDDRDDLFILELHQRPIELTLLQQTEESEGDREDGFRSSLESGNLELQLMPFLPSSCFKRSQQWFEELPKLSNPDEQAGTAPGPTSHAGESFPMAYLTPEMRIAQPMASQVYEDFEPYTYTEHLIVLAQHANEPAIQALIESLKPQIGKGPRYSGQRLDPLLTDGAARSKASVIGGASSNAICMNQVPRGEKFPKLAQAL